MTTPLPTVPSALRSTTFAAEMDVLLPAFVVFQQEIDALAAQLAGLAAGTAVSLPYIFSTTTTDADPTAFYVRLDNATQNTATTVRLSLTGSEGYDWTAMIDSFTTATSVVKGVLRIIKAGDATKYLQFNLTASASPSGYRNLTVTLTGSSAANPFTNGDNVVINFARAGATGFTGTVQRHTTSVTSTASPTPNFSIDDMYELTALATPPTFGAPTGVVGATPSNGQGLGIRMKDDGTPRALAYNAIYRASSDLGLPSTTIAGKWLYLGFTYNATAVKWDLVAVLNNF